MIAFFQYDFMVYSLVIGTIIAIVAPLIGLFLVHKRSSALTDTLSHTALLGVAIGLMSNIPIVISAIISSVLASLGIEALKKNQKLYGESILVMIMSISLALATILLSFSSRNIRLESFLFGEITFVSLQDVAYTAVLGLGIVIIVAINYKKLFLVTLDSDLAAVSGVKVSVWNAVLAILAALVVSVMLPIVGALLTGALMIIPVMSAKVLAKSFKQTLVFAMILSLFAVYSGIITSFYLNLPAGPVIVVLSVIGFVTCLGVSSLVNEEI